MAADETVSPEKISYPEGEGLRKFVKKRRRTGKFWRSLFLLATTIAIIALSVLLINIINDSFGYVAIQNKIDPEELVLRHVKEIVLASDMQVTSEDDQALAEGVAKRSSAIGFFGYGYYEANSDALRLLPVNGIAPSAETVESGEYLMSRPLLLYSSQKTLLEKEQVAAYLYYYLANVRDQILDIGYFPASQEAMDQAMLNWEKATGLTATTVDTLVPVGDIVLSGSSTVAPISEFMAQDFADLLFPIDITVNSVGTGAGFTAYCTEEAADIVDASRPIQLPEENACLRKGLTPLSFRIGSDGIAVVVSQENDFVDALTTGQLAQIFTTAETWADVNPDWPDKPILKFIPGADSGTLDFFVASVFGTELAELPEASLIAILQANLSTGLIRRLDSEVPLVERSQGELHDLVRERVVEPEIVKTWSLFESIFNKAEIEAEVAQIPKAELEFRNWLTWQFITSPQSSRPELAGIRTAILGSLWVVFISMLISIPIGIGAAIYLEEYGSGNWLDNLIETNINNLAGVPSIIYGMLGLAIFVRVLEPLTSGALFGIGDPTTANGRTIMAAGFTLGLLILPLIIINAREAIRAVPASLREASFGLGATKWQTIWHHVLPNAIPGILTGSILAVSRAFGETAPLVVIGAATFIVVDPTSPFAKFTTLTIQIYQWTSRPQQEFQHLAAAGIIVLLIMLLALNATAIWLRNRYQRNY